MNRVLRLYHNVFYANINTRAIETFKFIRTCCEFIVSER